MIGFPDLFFNSKLSEMIICLSLCLVCRAWGMYVVGQDFYHLGFELLMTSWSFSWLPIGLPLSCLIVHVSIHLSIHPIHLSFIPPSDLSTNSSIEVQLGGTFLLFHSAIILPLFHLELVFFQQGLVSFGFFFSISFLFCFVFQVRVSLCEAMTALELTL